MSFEGKTAVVTGAASGIGREVARRIAADGGHPLLVDIDGPAVEAAAAEVGAEAMTVNVADSAQVQAAVDHIVAKHGRLDLMFNNAGVAIFGEVEEVSLEEWDKIIDVNFRGVAYGTTIAYRQMVSQEKVGGSRGQIINTASGAGLAPVALQSHYCGTKHGVVGLSKTVAVESARRGIDITVFCPGFVDTGMFENNTMRGTLDGTDPTALIPIKPLSTEKAVDRLLRGVEKHRSYVITPFYARLGWWVERFSPTLGLFVHRQAFKDLKRRARSQKA